MFNINHLKKILLKKEVSFGIIVGMSLAIAGLQLSNYMDQRNSPPQTSKEYNEQNILDIPFNGTKEEKDAHLKAALSLAKDTDTVSVQGCHSSPVVAAVTKGTMIKFHNPSPISYTLIIEDKKIDLPSGKSINIKPEFIQGAGLYAYGCTLNNERPVNAGIFIVN